MEVLSNALVLQSCLVRSQTLLLGVSVSTLCPRNPHSVCVTCYREDGKGVVTSGKQVPHRFVRDPFREITSRMERNPRRGDSAGEIKWKSKIGFPQIGEEEEFTGSSVVYLELPFKMCISVLPATIRGSNISFFMQTGRF